MEFENDFELFTAIKKFNTVEDLRFLHLYLEQKEEKFLLTAVKEKLKFLEKPTLKRFHYHHRDRVNVEIQLGDIVCAIVNTGDTAKKLDFFLVEKFNEKTVKGRELTRGDWKTLALYRIVVLSDEQLKSLFKDNFYKKK